MTDLPVTGGRQRMRALIIDDMAKETAARVIEYAKGHPYHPASGAPVPGGARYPPRAPATPEGKNERQQTVDMSEATATGADTATARAACERWARLLREHADNLNEHTPDDLRRAATWFDGFAKGFSTVAPSQAALLKEAREALEPFAAVWEFIEKNEALNAFLQLKNNDFLNARHCFNRLRSQEGGGG